MEGFGPKLNEALRGKVAQAYIPAAAAADATKTWPVFYADRPCKILSFGIVPQADITGADTNSANLNVINKGTDGNGATEIGNKDFTAGVNANDFDYTEIVAETAGKRMAAGQVLSLQREKVGTGLALPELLAVVVYEYEP